MCGAPMWCCEVYGSSECDVTLLIARRRLLRRAGSACAACACALYPEGAACAPSEWGWDCSACTPCVWGCTCAVFALCGGGCACVAGVGCG